MLDASFGQASVCEHSKVPAERHERVMLHRCGWRGVEFRETWLGEFRNHAFDGDLCALGELRLCSRDRGGDVKTPPDSLSTGRTVPTSAPIARLVERLAWRRGSRLFRAVFESATGTMIGRARRVSIVAEVGVRGAAGSHFTGLAGLHARVHMRLMGSQNYSSWPP